VLVTKLSTSSDRIRTVVNVLGDSFGAAIVEHFSKKELKTFPDPHAITNNNNNNAIVPMTIDDKGHDNVVFEERM